MKSILPNTEQFLRSPVGLKYIMAVTGIILFGFLIGHLIGNLQVFLGATVFNDYSLFLHETLSLLWGTRIVLLASVALHIWASVKLALLKKRARPKKYVVKNYRAASYASRTMFWSGPLVAAFVIYHLLHFTTGQAHHRFIEGDPYNNMVSAFQRAPVAIAYMVSMVLLGFHLYHGLYSMLASLGTSYRLFDPWARRFTAVFAILLTLGFLILPLAVLTGIVQETRV